MCRRCFLAVEFAQQASACETCTYTVCESCLPPGLEVWCEDCTRPSRRVPRPVSDAPHHYESTDNGLSFDAAGEHVMVPPPMRLRFHDGVRWITPRAPVPTRLWDMASPVRRVRLAVLATVPPATAAAWRRALATFESFLLSEDIGWSDVDQAVTADFVVWRACPPWEEGLSRRVVRSATALSELARLRAYRTALHLDVSGLYGPLVTAVLRRLGANERHDSVRKTPVSWADAVRLAEKALRRPKDWELVRDASLIITGLCFFLRGGETDVDRSDVAVDAAGVTFTWRHQKTRGSAVARALPVSRSCNLRVLVDVSRCWLSLRGSGPGPWWPRSAGPSPAPVSTDFVRQQLVLRFGTPPLLPGEDRVLPWSLRAGAATACFAAGLPPDRIRRLGRWSSEVALMYAVLTPAVQAVTFGSCLRDFVDGLRTDGIQGSDGDLDDRVGDK